MSRRPLSSVSGTGSFDYPPASTSNPSNTSANGELNSSFTPRLQHLRRMFSRERTEYRARQQNNQRQNGDRPGTGMPPSNRNTSRRGGRFRRSPPPPGQASRPPRRNNMDREELGTDGERRPALPHAPRGPPRAQEPSLGERMRQAREGLRFSEADRYLVGRDHDESMEDLVRAGEHLAEMSSSLNELLDTFSPVADGLRRASSPPAGSSLRPSKRRKTSHEDSRPEYVGYKYGYWGQVEPGRLKLEIAHCDGGTYDDDNRVDLYKAENVLKNDKSVYCTRSNQCNLLLRHQNEASFSVQRIVIKAPERGFTAPVQEGLVFVSMSGDELMSKTRNYRISWAPPDLRTSRESTGTSSTSRTSPDLNEPLSFVEAMNDPEIGAHLARQQGVHAYDYSGANWYNDEYGEYPYFGSLASNAENCDLPYPFAIPPSANLPITTGSAESESDGSSSSEEDTAGAILADRLRRESRWIASSPDSDDDDEVTARQRIRNRMLYESSTSQGRRSRGVLRASRRMTPAWVSVSGDHDDVKDEEMKPLARFFIQKDKNQITIKFDTPISGKYIMLKMWSPVPNGNIDVQNVAAYGFVGQRFIPSIDFA